MEGDFSEWTVVLDGALLFCRRNCLKHPQPPYIQEQSCIQSKHTVCVGIGSK